MGKFLGDLFKGLGGDHWELARILAFYAVVSYSLMGAFILSLVVLVAGGRFAPLGAIVAVVIVALGYWIDPGHRRKPRPV